MEENGKRIEETGSQRGVSLSRRIVKAMGVFGGVQVLTMLFSLIRIKLLAIFVGPAGVGLLGILNSTLDMTYSATSLSLRNSSVRDIAAEGDERHRRSIIAVLRRWSLLVGALGLLVVLVASPLFSLSAFKSTAYTWAFLAVAVVMMFNALADGEKAVLQGTGQLRYLASSQVWGAALGLAACIPLFYFLKDDGIVPAVIACSALAALAMWCYGRKAVPYSLRADVPWRDTWRVGRGFVKLGFFMMLSTFMGFLANYLFVMWLTHSGGVNTVGLYQAGYTIVDKYAGLIFTAMAVEYYPRLACVVADKLKAAEYVSRQIGVTMVVMLPVVVIMMLLASPIVAILYSEKFMAAVPCGHRALGLAVSCGVVVDGLLYPGPRQRQVVLCDRDAQRYRHARSQHRRLPLWRPRRLGLCLRGWPDCLCDHHLRLLPLLLPATAGWQGVALHGRGSRGERRGDVGCDGRRVVARHRCGGYSLGRKRCDAMENDKGPTSYRL